LKNEGFEVERSFELGGNLAHDALLSDQIDVYPEYTGTAFTAILKHQPINDTQKFMTKRSANTPKNSV
jgi:glycine betaine/choline ABC-type transport system substrate-binding protein